MLPLWLALGASLALHLGLLLAPGWSLPFEGAPPTTILDARIVQPSRPAATLKRPAPPVEQRRSRKIAPPVSAAHPVADLSGASIELPPAPEPFAPPASPTRVASSEEQPVADDGMSARAAGVHVPAAQSGAANHDGAVSVGRWPRRGRIVYQVMYGENGLIVGRSEHRWEHDGMRYHLHAEVETVGLVALFKHAKVTQDSEGLIEEEGLFPLEFTTQRDDRPAERVRFDREAGLVWLADGRSVPSTAQVQDLLSLFSQLGLLAPEGGQLAMTVATGRKLAAYLVFVDEEALLETPLGPRRARHLEFAGETSEQATEVWLDAQTRLPIRIRHRDRKGELFDQVATSIEIDSAE